MTYKREITFLVPLLILTYSLTFFKIELLLHLPIIKVSNDWLSRKMFLSPVLFICVTILYVMSITFYFELPIILSDIILAWHMIRHWRGVFSYTFTMESFISFNICIYSIFSIYDLGELLLKPIHTTALGFIVFLFTMNHWITYYPLDSLFIRLSISFWNKLS